MTDLSETLSTPDVIVSRDLQSTAAAIADRLVDRLIGRKAHTHISVTGGGLGGAIWPAVAAHPKSRAVRWDRMHIWFSDERFLPGGDPERNDTAVVAVADSLGLLREHIHSVAGPDSTTSVDGAVYGYALELWGRRVLRPGDLPAPVFAVSILGVGPDGHVASLFPGRPEVGLREGTVVAITDSPKPPPIRVSFTRLAIEHCQELWMIAAGAEKAAAVDRAMRGDDPNRTPAAGLHGLGRTLWFIDEALAAGLTA